MGSNVGHAEIDDDDVENQRLQFPRYDALCAYCPAKVQRGATLEHAGSG